MIESGYRGDIDGLRAIAVLSVVLFHINPALVPGGFAGVDIFFVLSGYLITTNIRNDVSAGRFSLSRFYARRVKRIIPALATVVFATLIAGQLILIPEHFEELAGSAIASMLSAANIYFTYFVDTGYFAEESSTKPLLHIWSLGVEEQFYLFWPMIAVVLVSRLGRSAAGVAIVGALTAALFVLSEWIVQAEPTFGYYMLPSRAAELLIGATLSFLPATWANRLSQRHVGEAISICGFALIAYSLGLIHETDAFPGFNAIPSTLGTALLIAAGQQHKTLSSRALSLAPMLWFGWISYSLYLWHWPVVAYLRYAYIDITPLVGAMAFVGMVAASVLSYRFVETPFRAVSAPPSRIFAWQFAAPTAVLVCLASLVIATSGFGTYLWNDNYMTRFRAGLVLFQPNYSYDYVCQRGVISARDLDNPRCIINGEHEPSIVLWGDSHAAHYTGVLGGIAEKSGASFRNFEHSACPPIVEDGARFALARYRENCTASLAVAVPRVFDYDTVILGGQWSVYHHASKDFVPALAETVKIFLAQGKKVVILAQTPRIRAFDRHCDQKALKLRFLDCQTMFNSKRSDRLPEARANQAIADALPDDPGVEMFDISDTICPKGICSPYFEGQLSYYDPSHLNMPASWRIGERLAADGRGPAVLTSPLPTEAHTEVPTSIN